LWILGGSNAVGGFGQIVGGVTELNPWSQEEPIGAWFAKWHAYAAGVHHASFSYHSIKLHVGVAADDDWLTNSVKERHKARFGRKAGKDLCVVARRSMAKQHLAQILDSDS
jgi:hypothetical protein